MIINCPSCGAGYECDHQYIGKKLACSSCNKEFEVKNTNLVPCPDCFVPISKRAATCPHCGACLRDISAKDIVQSGNSLASEKDILFCHPSAMNYLWAIVFGVLTIPALFGILILLYIWIEIHYTSYKITNQRVIVNRGWIGKVQNEIWIKDMRGAVLAQGIWQRIIGVGNISIGTAATAGTEICMVGIGNPQKVVDTINSLRN